MLLALQLRVQRQSSRSLTGALVVYFLFVYCKQRLNRASQYDTIR